MKRTSRSRLVRVAMATVLAVVLGTIAPSLVSAVPASAATDGQMVYPASGNIQSKVGDGCRGNYRAHDGIDISGQGGTPILAAYDGVIKLRASNGGYGFYTDVEHPGGYVTRYGHMAAQGMYAPGTRVVRGQQIGVVGDTGSPGAYHLHFEVWRNGSIYSQINQGFTCLSNITRGNTLPLVFPGLATQPVPVLLTDFDADGRADLLGVAADGDLHFIKGDGNGRFQPGAVVTTAWGIHKHLSSADFNRDGRADMLVVRSDGALEFYGGSATGGFDDFRVIGSGWYGMLQVTSGADYTGDGKHDIVAVTPTGALLIYPGNGAAGFAGAEITAGSGWHGFRFVIGGDFNGDGAGDLMTVDSNGILRLYPGQYNGFGAPQAISGGWGALRALTGGSDYTGDGKADLVGVNASGEMIVYVGTGAIGFSGSILVGAGWGGYALIE
ncbi:VCBS repeat domain-containing M23 family metallopeptidase [Microbacterium sp. LWO12-1.2]|uniref:VCBS repeat domain-containing M23 family metallopeptidase n=1 Tax=Microbacterium sp. LWO12-1.2 TaxID=3135261 RepID=UPI0034124048